MRNDGTLLFCFLLLNEYVCGLVVSDSGWCAARSEEDWERSQLREVRRDGKEEKEEEEEEEEKVDFEEEDEDENGDEEEVEEGQVAVERRSRSRRGDTRGKERGRSGQERRRHQDQDKRGHRDTSPVPGPAAESDAGARRSSVSLPFFLWMNGVFS